ncbi:urease accessory protein UreF [Aestuariivirga sp.]|uniref:urease accessory protein UreF n=1 Tax=Aestuariivirga sp. TaxID=2650926 RepID=UPI0039E3726F
MPMVIEARQLLLLLNWMSPAFPTGQFAYSHGLEWAIEDHIVQSADDLEQWISDLVTRGSGWNDVVLFSHCWEDDARELNELALALASSRERHLETAQLGRAFSIAVGVFLPSPIAGEGGSRVSARRMRGRAAGISATPHPPSGHLLPQGEKGNGEDEIAYPIAAGVACHAMGIPKENALLAFLQAFCAALTSVAVRLVPIGQTAGLEVLRDLMPVISATAERAASSTLDDLGSITLFADAAAMRHETQTSRVFRT